MDKPKLYKIEKIEQKTPKVKSFCFYSEKISREAKPGQFLMVWVPGFDEFPISIASAYNRRIEIAVAKVGKGTEALHKFKVGDYIGIRGPYGNWFNNLGEKVCAVVGGYGSPAIRFYAEKNKKDLTVFLGAKTKEELLYKEEIEKFARVKVATEDGSEGFKGLVTELFSQEIEKEKFDRVMSCGPEIMMKKVCEITRDYKIPTQVLTERIVKCAKGFCGSCDLGGYRICKEGPVFDSEKIYGKTEFGVWTRDKSGKRASIKGILSEDFSSFLSEQFTPKRDEYFETELCGIKFPNPFMNSSGFGISGKLLYRYAIEGGAGALVTKSVCLEEKEGFDGPNFFEIKKFTPINAMGLPNPGIGNMKYEIEDMKKANVPVILSVFGKNPEEYKKVAEIGVDYGISMVEINVSCPHTEVSSIEENPELVKEIVKEVARVCHPFGIPVSVKISPNSNYIEVAKAAEEGWANSIVAINTLRYMPIDKKLNLKMLGSPSGFGGISGKGIKKLSEKILKDLRKEIDLPIISVGGIFSWKDALKRFTFGASACQIGSAIGYKGIKVFEEIKNGLKNYMEKNGYKNINELISFP